LRLLKYGRLAHENFPLQLSLQKRSLDIKMVNLKLERGSKGQQELEAVHLGNWCERLGVVLPWDLTEAFRHQARLVSADVAIRPTLDLENPLVVNQ